jgi:hypothetical protein
MQLGAHSRAFAEEVRGGLADNLPHAPSTRPTRLRGASIANGTSAGHRTRCHGQVVYEFGSHQFVDRNLARLGRRVVRGTPSGPSHPEPVDRSGPDPVEPVPVASGVHELLFASQSVIEKENS